MMLVCAIAGLAVQCYSNSPKPTGWASWVLLRTEGSNPGRYIPFVANHIVINASFQAVPDPSLTGDFRTAIDPNVMKGATYTYLLVALGSDAKQLAHSAPFSITVP